MRYSAVTLLLLQAKGGNLLLNCGPGPDGSLPHGAVNELEAMASWFEANGEAVHDTYPVFPHSGLAVMACGGDPGRASEPASVAVHLTARASTVYALIPVTVGASWEACAGLTVRLPFVKHTLLSTGLKSVRLLGTAVSAGHPFPSSFH